MKIGRRLAIKLLNASKFVLGFGDDTSIDASAITTAVDRAFLARLAGLVDDATRAFDSYDYARALERTETFFWTFTDNHVELVKPRAYGETGDAETRSAQHALRLGLSTMLRLFAPLLPFVTEEVWSWWHTDSVHRNPWPDAEELRAVAAGVDPAVSDVAAEVLGEIRRAKTEAKKSLTAPVDRVVVTDTAARLAHIAQTLDDVRTAGKVTEPITVVEGSVFAVTVTLAD